MAWTNNGDNSTLFADPTNGGTGFIGWTSEKTASPDSGYFIGNSTLGAGNVNVEGSAFGMYGHTGTFAVAKRKLINALDETNDAFTLNFSLNFRNGEKGVLAYSSSGGLLFGFRAVSDNYQYYTPSTSWLTLAPADWPYSPNGIYTFFAKKINDTQTNCIVTRNDNPPAVNVNITTSDFFELSFYVQNTTGAGANQDNLYFNQLSSFNGYR